MIHPEAAHTLDAERRRIADRIRILRQERHWSQSALADRLGLSQSRLSEIERGQGSFTAEQLLAVLKTFNVPASYFAGSRDRKAELQNALARLGAAHLHESSDVLPSEELRAAQDVVREALVLGVPRLITALGPVLVGNVDRINLNKLYGDLAIAGLDRRVGWLVANVIEAVRRELGDTLPRAWALRCRRAEVVLSSFLETITIALQAKEKRQPPPDILDSTIRSAKTLEEVRASSSAISRHWGIVTTLQPDDFAEALRSARARG